MAVALALVLSGCGTAPPPVVDVVSPRTPTKAAVVAVDRLDPPTPRPKPTMASRSRVRPPAPVSWPRTRVVRIIRAAAIRYGLNVDRFLAMIRCESGFNPRAVGGGGQYWGLGQHDRRWWPERARRAGYPGGSWDDPYINANVTAWMVTKAGYSPWPVCGFL